MSSASRSALLHASRHRIARSSIWAAAIGLSCGFVTSAQAQTKEQAGQWSPQNTVTFSIGHMVLLPGGGSYHSRILMWDGVQPSGAEFGWNTGAAGCDDWPYSLVRLDSVWNPPVRLQYAGHAQLAASRGLLTVGGVDGLTTLGVPDALKHAPGSGASPGTWSARADMQQSRQRPTLTALRDGRMLVAGGLRYRHVWYFGGRVDGNPPTSGAGDSLFRFGSGTKRIWDPAVKPLAEPETNRPSPREGHTTVNFLSDAGLSVALFGGKNDSGITTDNDVYLLKREDIVGLDPDYTYRWSTLPVSGDPPPARSDHVAIELASATAAPSDIVIYGGVSQPSGGPTTVRDDFWKLARDPGTGVWGWSQVSQGGTGPGPRYGHAAVRNGNLIYLFGGSAAPGADPTDNEVYEFNFSNGQWRVLPVAAGSRPEPRRDHTMVLAGTSLLIYGGHIDTLHSSAALWKLALGSTSVWSEIQTGGSSPGPRANHSALYDVVGQRLTIFGGERPTASDPSVDRYIYSIFPNSGTPTWVREPVAPYRLSGHTVVADPFEVLHARIPEIYDPQGDTWTAQTGSGWMPPANLIWESPVQFLVPGSSIPGGGGRVLRVGQDPKTRYLDLPATGLAGAWQEVAANVISGDTLHPATGVQYLPGKILVAGNGPEEDDPPVIIQDHRARTFDATAIEAATWVDADSEHLMGRINVDLLVLPNGKVMIQGTEAETRPQIWDPSSRLWTGLLATEGIIRGHKSTMLLLPDGRVLRGGGFAGGGPILTVFCPPYLFSGDNLAPRPTITSAPDSVVYGESFLIGKSSTDQIGAVCLIRPGAVSYHFDQNGRYVPLSFETVADNTQVRAYAPLSGSVAPPGDYLLFILNTSGVPAIAKWIHLGNCAVVPCDTDSPPQVTTLYADIVGPNEAWMVWYAPGDDVTPLAGEYDLRYSTATINGEDTYLAATQSQNEPAVASAGTPITFVQYNLASCTNYSFALKTRDGFGNWSLRSAAAPVSTTCNGGGGGYSAQQVSGAGLAGRTASSMSALTSTASASDSYTGSSDSTSTESGVLVAETQRTASGGWQVTLRLYPVVDGVDDADPQAIVSQIRAPGGAWRTLGRYQPTAGQSPLGVCALREQGRLVFPDGHGLDQVSSGLRAGGEHLALVSAEHSRLGALRDSALGTAGGVEMAVGDVVTATYVPTTATDATTPGWYLLVRPAGATRTRATLARGEGAITPPTEFALHRNRPNPFTGSTTIGFDLPVASAVSLEVFDLLGRRVATLARGQYPAGRHAAVWDLRESSGASVRPGIYVYRLEAGTFRARRKMSVLQ